MNFDWKLSSSDANTMGSPVRELVLRMDTNLRENGLPIEGFEFLHSSSKMLEITRQIEDELSRSPESATLHVGFQRIDKVDNELDRYNQLRNSGTQVYAYGVGIPTPDQLSVVDDWISLAFSVSNVENQWFLVSESPTPIAFVGWETSKELFGQGKLSNPEKMFEGFVSSDERVIKSLISHLDSVRLRKQLQPMSVDTIAMELEGKVKKVMVITQDKPADKLSPGTKQSLNSSVSLCKALEAEVTLYDLSAASYFVNPGPPGTAWTGINLSGNEVESLGRSHLSKQIIEFQNEGLNANAVLAGKHGFQAIEEAATREKADVVIVPQYYEYPNLVDRIVGNTLGQIKNSNIPQLMISTEDGHFRQLNTSADRNCELTLTNSSDVLEKFISHHV